MFDLYKEIIEDGSMHLTARRGLIVLLEKLGKNLLSIDSWRPLSMLNADYKIFAKFLAMRVQTAVTTLVDYTQSGAMPNAELTSRVAPRVYKFFLSKQHKKTSNTCAYCYLLE